MPDRNMLDVVVLAAYIANCRLQTARKPVLSCFELNPCILELVTTFVILQCVSADWS